ncbi:bifunctional folylpolyglutamate synthase/dihydrofolate synthase [Jeotgalibacillus proteolyticus]|uniref:Dihydrofolate synthase/folylpolyglutamate synthase n=1 Tax=Jeotgalibacillus proteolyticus TaxID=2082395 RepID=A0A2S5GF58_9BACL|nr:folylpolyglutamate synthase/dihydrofolate synthase family protein [Jeotgalibacillus proteolyticus]PPA71551.1 bifunctional folylpolyglutamate synthase/dihydrofolate synthase [Jeotgalibacillus proteolyticus]
MIDTYNEAIDWIHSRLRLGIKPGLTRMEWMLDKLENPQNKINAIHIGGTNGKGSTVAYLRSILQSSGAVVGTFTSPYFETFNERIAVNGKPVSNEDWLHLTQQIEPLADELESSSLGGPTEFEVITAMMFLYFGSVRPVDVVLVEVGLGGRFDSTNVITPVCSIITSIGLDHMAILGETYREIAAEKAGIIKPGVPVVINIKNDEARTVIEETAAQKNAPLYSYGKDFWSKAEESGSSGERFNYSDQEGMLKISMGMTGEHQIENASLALFVTRFLSRQLIIAVSQEEMLNGIKKTYWPGRTEILSDLPLVMMDGAHNKEGIEALIKTIDQKYQKKSVHFLFAAVGDKDLSKMIGMLDNRADSMAFDTFDMPRAAAAQKLAELSSHPNKYEIDAGSWIRKAIENSDDDLYVVTGSLYYLSSVHEKIKKILKYEKRSDFRGSIW